MIPDELRRFINARGRPLEFLAAIASGRKVSAADPREPGQKVRVYPSLDERIVAARTLLNKLMPDMKATELTGKDGGPVSVETKEVDKVKLARRIAFALAQGVAAKETAEAPPVLHALLPEPAAPEPGARPEGVVEPEGLPQVAVLPPAEQVVGAYVVRGDGRGGWEAVNALTGAPFTAHRDRDALVQMCAAASGPARHSSDRERLAFTVPRRR